MDIVDYQSDIIDYCNDIINKEFTKEQNSINQINETVKHIYNDMLTHYIHASNKLMILYEYALEQKDCKDKNDEKNAQEEISEFNKQYQKTYISFNRDMMNNKKIIQEFYNIKDKDKEINILQQTNEIPLFMANNIYNVLNDEQTDNKLLTCLEEIVLIMYSDKLVYYIVQISELMKIMKNNEIEWDKRKRRKVHYYDTIKKDENRIIQSNKFIQDKQNENDINVYNFENIFKTINHIFHDMDIEIKQCDYRIILSYIFRENQEIYIKNNELNICQKYKEIQDKQKELTIEKVIKEKIQLMYDNDIEIQYSRINKKKQEEPWEPILDHSHLFLESQEFQYIYLHCDEEFQYVSLYNYILNKYEKYYEISYYQRQKIYGIIHKFGDDKSCSTLLFDKNNQDGQELLYDYIIQTYKKSTKELLDNKTINESTKQYILYCQAKFSPEIIDINDVKQYETRYSELWQNESKKNEGEKSSYTANQTTYNLQIIKYQKNNCYHRRLVSLQDSFNMLNGYYLVVDINTGQKENIEKIYINYDKETNTYSCKFCSEVLSKEVFFMNTHDYIPFEEKKEQEKIVEHYNNFVSIILEVMFGITLEDNINKKFLTQHFENTILFLKNTKYNNDDNEEILRGLQKENSYNGNEESLTNEENRDMFLKEDNTSIDNKINQMKELIEEQENDEEIKEYTEVILLLFIYFFILMELETSKFYMIKQEFQKYNDQIENKIEKTETFFAKFESHHLKNNYNLQYYMMVYIFIMEKTKLISNENFNIFINNYYIIEQILLKNNKIILMEQYSLLKNYKKNIELKFTDEMVLFDVQKNDYIIQKELYKEIFACMTYKYYPFCMKEQLFNIKMNEFASGAPKETYINNDNKKGIELHGQKQIIPHVAEFIIDKYILPDVVNQSFYYQSYIFGFDVRINYDNLLSIDKMKKLLVVDMENKQIKEIYKNHNEQEEIEIFDIKYGDNIKIFVFYQLDVIINLMGINQYNIIENDCQNYQYMEHEYKLINNHIIFLKNTIDLLISEIHKSFHFIQEFKVDIMRKKYINFYEQLQENTYSEQEMLTNNNEIKKRQNEWFQIIDTEKNQIKNINVTFKMFIKELMFMIDSQEQILIIQKLVGLFYHNYYNIQSQLFTYGYQEFIYLFKRDLNINIFQDIENESQEKQLDDSDDDDESEEGFDVHDKNNFNKM